MNIMEALPAHTVTLHCMHAHSNDVKSFSICWLLRREKTKIQQSFLVYKQMNCNLKLNNNDLTQVDTVDHTGDEENFIQESQILASESLAWYKTSSMCWNLKTALRNWIHWTKIHGSEFWSCHLSQVVQVDYSINIKGSNFKVTQ